MKNKIGWKCVKRLILALLILLCVNLGASSDQTGEKQAVLAEQKQR